jgi:perosamine synthetase
MNKIPLSKPTFDEETKKALIDVLDSGWVGNGPKVLEFEKAFAEYVGAKYAVATNSATSALDICLKVYDIQGGELITTPMTFVSDAIVGEFNSMDVTFGDIDPLTLCLDPKSLVITADTRAIIAVDSHGRLADIKGIREACGAFKPLIIEDAAHAMYTPGVGEGDITVYSFQAVKTLPIFDGGMITTNDETIYKKLKTLTWLGIEKSTYDRVGAKGYAWDYEINHTGIKGYMTDVQAVIGLGQLKRLDKMNAKRREIADKYNYAFRKYDWFRPPAYSNTVQYYTGFFAYKRNELSEFLAENGIHTSVHFKPLSEMNYWKKAVKRPLPNTDYIWHMLLSLPVHDSLTDEEQTYIINKVIEFYE